MIPSATAHILLDERGQAFIDDTGITVLEVVLDKLAYEWSPEAIHIQHPELSLAQIYAAFAYYYDHKIELDAEMERQYEQGKSMWQAQRKHTPLHRRLRSTEKIS